MSRVDLVFSNTLTPCDPGKHPVLIVGQLKNLLQLGYEQIKVKLQPRVSKETYNSAVSSLHPSPIDSCSMWLTQATVAALPTKCSRHNSPSRPHSLTKVIRSCIVGGEEYIVIVCEKPEVFASACAIARAFPLYSRKSCSQMKRTVNVEFVLVGPSGVRTLSASDLRCMCDAAEGVRMAARITDIPCADMHTDAFVEDIKAVAQKLSIKPVIIHGQQLKDAGFGGIYAVGQGATHKPAFVVLSHTPDGASRTIAWVGKGVVYDTGGLSIKGKANMPGMKRDCGGAAAVLGAFYTAVKQGFRDNLHALLCLAENAVGPDSLRPDDIITLYSGRTVEVNNTDAEGRLVLGDGVAYAHQELKADIILDIATLTGAQGLATGRYHGAMVTNREEWEKAAVDAGRSSGDLIHPLIYCPELHFSEFASAVADMKNSSADRSNTEVSCAGLFVGSHIGFDFPGVWIHVDIAYPVFSGERATGYGVGLLLALFGDSSSSELLQSISPSCIMVNGLAYDECTTKKIRLS
ncbi:putative aminopeptidase NPEPL1 [Lamellibrachia satsuma]|nr:putative aminopeptidase NPEPL1 [Lamellibrachia satsuma]